MDSIKDFPPNVHTYRQYLDNLGDKRRAPKWTISRTESDGLLTRRTGCPRYQPGQYKIERDFPTDVTSEVQQGKLSGSASSRKADFQRGQSRVDSDGVLKGIRNY